ncbi:hypothetical protein HAX54_019745, partial [Datura stramonium]|nr:hypothetical protein [Datura stramonium]
MDFMLFLFFSSSIRFKERKKEIKQKHDVRRSGHAFHQIRPAKRQPNAGAHWCEVEGAPVECGLAPANRWCQRRPDPKVTGPSCDRAVLQRWVMSPKRTKERTTANDYQ